MSTLLKNSLFKNHIKILETGELSDIEVLVGREPNTEIFCLHFFFRIKNLFTIFFLI